MQRPWVGKVGRSRYGQKVRVTQVKGRELKTGGEKGRQGAGKPL